MNATMPSCWHVCMLACLHMAAGCAAVPDEPPPAAVEDSPPAALPPPERPSRPAFVGTGRPALVPRAALWLSEPLEARYAAAPASAVIREIAQRRPIRMTFDATASDPLVSAPPGAVTIQDHLEAVCSQADWSYTVANGVVLVHDMETRLFALASQPGSSSAEIRLRNLEAGDAEGGGNSVDVELDPYADEVGALVKGFLGLESEGGAAPEPAAAAAFGPPTLAAAAPAPAAVDPRTSVTVLPSASQLAVTARPHQVRQVARLLAEYNAATAAAVQVDIVVYEVDSSGEDTRSVDVDALRTAALKLGAEVTHPSADEAAGGLSVTFAEGNAYDNSEAVLRWLRTRGRTSIAFQDRIFVRNNAVAAVDATQKRRYVSRIARETLTAGPSQVATPTVEFDELRTGWAVLVQPTIVDDVVTVRLGLSRSSLVSEVPYSFEGVSGTNFVTNDYNRAMSVTVGDGETRLLTSLASSESRKTGRRTPWLPWLGDGRSETTRERETVMMISARVL